MSMSKRDFVSLADAIRQDLCGFRMVYDENTPDVSVAKVVDMLARFCKHQNYAFKEDRWRSYLAGECGPSGGAIKQPKPRRRIVCEDCGGLEKTHGANCATQASAKR